MYVKLCISKDGQYNSFFYLPELPKTSQISFKAPLLRKSVRLVDNYSGVFLDVGTKGSAVRLGISGLGKFDGS